MPPHNLMSNHTHATDLAFPEFWTRRVATLTVHTLLPLLVSPPVHSVVIAACLLSRCFDSHNLVGKKHRWEQQKRPLSCVRTSASPRAFAWR